MSAALQPEVATDQALGHGGIHVVHPFVEAHGRCMDGSSASNGSWVTTRAEQIDIGITAA